MIMPSNHSSPIIHYWAGKYPGKIGWLVGPSSLKKTKFRAWVPYACDNDAYSAFMTKQPWNEAAWLRMLSLVQSPLWVLCPDEVANKDATLEKWDRYSPMLKERGFTVAFAAQDGMTEKDVPQSAEVIFIGGSTDWKWRNVARFCEHFSRVHVGRVNTMDRVYFCAKHGVESVDGTGWFRDGEDNPRLKQLERFLEGKPSRQRDLFEIKGTQC